ncbi:MAG: 1,4-dihydroxy-6-naphthoate synthase [Syntrophales bacterium]
MSETIELDIGFSPCPNDTFIFDALVNRRIDATPYLFHPRIADVEELNGKAFSGGWQVTKLSFYAYLLLGERYLLLDSGAALGYGCGPLLVAGTSFKSLEGARIAVPGRYTTAYLLLQLWMGGAGQAKVEFARFDEILPGIAAGRFDAGLIIHEGRFVYQRYNCSPLIDLGEWWEQETGLPIPLGCIAIRRDMASHQEAVAALIRDSVLHARKHPAVGQDFIKEHAQELDDKVTAEHIALYVNDFTLSLGSAGNDAISVLKERAERWKLL